MGSFSSLTFQNSQWYQSGISLINCFYVRKCWRVRNGNSSTCIPTLIPNSKSLTLIPNTNLHSYPNPNYNPNPNSNPNPNPNSNLKVDRDSQKNPSSFFCLSTRLPNTSWALTLLRGQNCMHFAHRPLYTRYTVTFNSNFVILKTWNCFQLE